MSSPRAATKPVLKLKNPGRFLLQQQKDRLSERWTTQHLIDEIFFSLMGVKRQFCMINKGDGGGTIRRLYEEQARYKMYRMPVFRPPPAFVIYLKDLDEKVREELAKEDLISRDLTLKQVADRIFEQVDRRYYLQSAKRILKVRLEP